MHSSSTAPVLPSFDPFGEPVSPELAPARHDIGDRLARRIGGAVFWSLALLILAGRVYAYGMPGATAVASQVAQLFAMR